MKVIDPGHIYVLETYDKLLPTTEHDIELTFMKRIGDNYPNNGGFPFPGTNCQEVIRVLIDRVEYLDNQHPSEHNKRIRTYLRAALREFEIRARARRDQPYIYWWAETIGIEKLLTCSICGHVKCLNHKEGEL